MKKYINIILLVLWMGVIFYFSNSTANVSDTHSGFFVNIINDIFNIDNIGLVTTIVRKLAHFTEYVILGILMFNVLKDYNIKRVIIISIILCIFYAISDEVHQLFIDGRSFEIYDICIDSIGSIVGNFIFKTIKRV